MVAIIIWVSAIASAFVDNIPFAATMVPVIQSLAALNGVNISTLAWDFPWEQISEEAQHQSEHQRM